MNAIGKLAAVCCGALLAAAPLRAQEGDEGADEWILERPVTLDMEKASVRQILDAVAKLTGLGYIAPDILLDHEVTFTVHVKGVPAERVLEQIVETLKIEADVDEETGTLFLRPPEPERRTDRDRPEFAPRLDHAQALERILAHPDVVRLRRLHPGLWVRLNWDADDRRWEADLILGEEEVGRVNLAEFEEGEPRIVEVEIEFEALAPEAARERDIELRKAREHEERGREERARREERPRGEERPKEGGEVF